MATLSTEERSVLVTVLRRVDKKVTFDIAPLTDRHVPLNLQRGRKTINVNVPLNALQAAGGDRVQAELVRRTLKRAVDRMQFVPPPVALDPKKVPSSVEAPVRRGPGSFGRGRR